MAPKTKNIINKRQSSEGSKSATTASTTASTSPEQKGEEVEEDEEPRAVRGGGGEYDHEYIKDGEDAATFVVDQEAYYRSPEGSVAKVSIISCVEDPNRPAKYAISLPDGSRLDNVKASRLVTLVDLTSKELSMLMKDRNKRQHEKNQRGGLVLPSIKPAVRMVEAKTEEGGRKMVPMYEAGMKVRYKNAAGIQLVEIVDVHLDDCLEPYYDVKLEDGREKQTDNAHILMLEPGKDGGGDEEQKEGKNSEVEKEKEELPEEMFCKAKEEAAKPPARKAHNSASERKVNSPPKKPQSVNVFKRSQDACSTSTKRKQDTARPATAVASAGSRLDSTAPAVDQPQRFIAGDEVLYNSSGGEHLRAVIVRLHRDKKNRAYYVVRLSEGKEKPVYGHRLSPFVRGDSDDSRKSRSCSRSASNSRGQSTSRGRSSSKVSMSGRRGHSKNPQALRRSESADSRAATKSTLSNSSQRLNSYGPRSRGLSKSRHRSSSRVSKSSRHSRSDQQEVRRSESAGSHKSTESTLSSTSRRLKASSERIGSRGANSSSSRGRRVTAEPLPPSSTPKGCQHAGEPLLPRMTRSSSERRIPRDRSRPTVRRSKSTSSPVGRRPEGSLRGERRRDRHVKERPRSRAPYVEGSSAAATPARGGTSRLTTPVVSRSSKTKASIGGRTGGEHPSTHSSSVVSRGEEQRSTSKASSISKLHDFRKSFANRKKKR